MIPGNRPPSALGRGRAPASRRAPRLASLLLRAAAVAGLVMITSVAVATTASAHNVLLQTSPVDKSTVATLPTTVTLTFNEPAQAIGSVLQVIGPAGNVAQGPPKLVDRLVSEAVQPGAPAGAYKVLWRVTSLDGHPISGEFSFTATAGDGGTAPTGAAAAQPATGTSSTRTSSSGTSGDSSTAIVVLLIVAGVLVVAAGVFLALRRPGPSLAADELPYAPAGASSGGACGADSDQEVPPGADRASPAADSQDHLT